MHIVNSICKWPRHLTYHKSTWTWIVVFKIFYEFLQSDKKILFCHYNFFCLLFIRYCRKPFYLVVTLISDDMSKYTLVALRITCFLWPNYWLYDSVGVVAQKLPNAFWAIISSFFSQSMSIIFWFCQHESLWLDYF